MTDSIVLQKWKNQMIQLLKMQNKKYDKDKLDRYLEEVIKSKLNNRKVALVNNYKNGVARTDILTLFNLIEENQLIIGGGGVLYLQHDVKPNVLVGFILHVMGRRSELKAERKKHDKKSIEWFMANLGQNSQKLLINALYGVGGYYRFITYNKSG